MTAATKCLAVYMPNPSFVCGKPKGHDGAHVAILPNATVAWGGMTR